MRITPPSSQLRESFIASPLKCSRSWSQIALTINGSTQMITWLHQIDPKTVLAIPNPTPIWGHIRLCTADFYWEDSTIKVGTWGDVSAWFLRKALDGTWSFSIPGSYIEPTPMAVTTRYNPRAYRTDSGDYSTYHQHPYSTKLKVFGACWGLLCHYPGQYYAASSDIDRAGPEDIYMRSIAPSSFLRKSQGSGASFEFTPLLNPLPITAEHPEGGPSISIFWPGRRPEDFPWYYSTGDAGLSTSEGP